MYETTNYSERDFKEQFAGIETLPSGCKYPTVDVGMDVDLGESVKDAVPQIENGQSASTPTNSLDVAAYILKRLGEISTVKLQKLVYYCQAWALVWDEEPLYSDCIEAWINGPVVPRLFSYHRGMFSLGHVRTGNPDLLTSDQRETIDSVLEFYGSMTAQQLVELSHSEMPWVNARKGMASTERGKRCISLDSIAEFYSGLSCKNL